MGTQVRTKRLGPGGVILVSVYGIVAVLFYAGFYFTAPSLPRRAVLVALWLARIVTPIVAVANCRVLIGLLDGRIRLQKIVLASVAVLFAGCLAIAVIAVTAAWYGRGTGGLDAALYHPYLQVRPTVYAPRAYDGDRPTLRIFCLGGSTTAFRDSSGIGWPERVELRLQAELPGLNVEVHNLGTPWYTSLHSLINYATNLAQHEPHVLVVMHGINDLLHNADFSNFSTGAFRRDYGHFVGPLRQRVRPKPLSRRLWTACRSIWYYSPPRRRAITTDDFPGLPAFRQNLESLVTLARSRDCRTILVTQPFLNKSEMTEQELRSLYMLRNEAVSDGARWSPQTALAGHTAYAAAVRAVAHTTGCGLMDLEHAVPKTLEYLYDDVHYTDAGHTLVGETVAGELIPIARELGRKYRE